MSGSSTQKRMDAMLSELQRATRINRVLVVIVLLLMVILIVLSFVGPRIRGGISVRNISVINADGRQVARIGYSENGHGRLTLFDANGNLKHSLGATKSGRALLSVYGKGGVRIAQIEDFPDGNGYFRLSRSSQTIIASMGTLDNGSGGIITYDPNGKGLVRIGTTWHDEGAIFTSAPDGPPLVQIGATNNGDGLVVTCTSEGRDLVAISSAIGGAGLVSTYGSKGTPLTKLTATMDDGGAITAYDATGKRAAHLGVAKFGSFLDLCNADGAIVMQAGADDDGNGRVGILNSESSPMLELHCTSNGEAAKIWREGEEEGGVIEIDVLIGERVEKCRFDGEVCDCEDAVERCRKALEAGGVSKVVVDEEDKRVQEGGMELVEALREMASKYGVGFEVVRAMSDRMDVGSG